jgi:hypothetical protein
MTGRVFLAFLIAFGVATAPAFAKLVQFRTPSANIGCVGETARAANFVRCDIASRSWSPPRRPASCRLDWGQGLALDRRGRSSWVCAGDTALNRGRILAYGARRVIGGITCVSRTSGLTCTNQDGHGFTLSRQRYRRF